MTRHKALGAAAALAAAAALQGAPAAWGGTYPMRNCNVPGQPAAGTGPWSFSNFPNSSSFNGCAGGGGFGIAFSAGRDMTANTTATIALSPPPGIAIHQVHALFRGRLHGTGSGLFVTASGPNQDSNILGPQANGELTDWTSAIFTRANSFFHLKLTCSASIPNTGCTAEHPHPLEVVGTDVSLAEDAAPAVSFAGGPLVSSGTQSGSRAVTYEAVDEQSGVARVEALLDGQLSGTVDFTPSPQCQYANWNACVTRQSGDLMVDTSVVPDGARTLQLRVTDAAGNQTVVQSPQSVVVANGPGAPSGAANGSGATADARLTAHFSKNRSRLTKSWSSTAVVRGRLTSHSGSAIANARIDVSELSTLAHSHTVARKPVHTAADGRFAYKVPARLSSRRIRFQYSDRVGSKPVATRNVRTMVRAATKLKARLRGLRIRYSGRVLSGPIPKRGLRVGLQGRAIGSSWETFAVRRTSRKGRFSGSYRLRVRRPGVRLQVRMVIPGRKSYPYATTHGRRVSLRVR